MGFVKNKKVVFWANHQLSNGHSICCENHLGFLWPFFLKSDIVAYLFPYFTSYFWSYSFCKGNSTDSSRLRHNSFSKERSKKLRNLGGLSTSSLSTDQSDRIALNHMNNGLPILVNGKFHFALIFMLFNNHSFWFWKYGDEFVVVILYNIKRKWRHLTLSQPIVLDTVSTNLPGCPLQIYSILLMLTVGSRNYSKLHTSLEIPSRRFPVPRCIYLLYEEKKKIFKSRILLKRITTIPRCHCCWVKYQCLHLQGCSTMRKGYSPLKTT